MRWAATLRLRVRSLFRRSRVEQELDEELRYHLEHLVDDYVASGMPPREARQAARRAMGAMEPRKEECRDARGLALIDSLRQDVTYALRALRRTPAFTLVAILSLAAGIGANTTIFTFVNAVLLRPLPYPDADRLVVLHEHVLGAARPLGVHPVNFVEWRARARSLETIVLVQAPPLNVLGPDGAEQIVRLLATPELFDVFGLRPAIGRSFERDDSSPRARPVVILGHGFWQRRYGGDPGVIGRRLEVPDGPLTIVGVAPAGFRIGSREPEAFTPMPLDPANPGATGSRAFEAYARLPAGVTLGAARAEMAAIAAILRQQHRFDENMGVFVSDLHEYLVREARPGLRLLTAVVAAMLLIVCVNLAGLLMARGVARRGELAVRAALGASRGRLVRQLVVESFLLSLCGGAAGLAIAYWATHALATLTAGALTAGSPDPIHLDARALLFTFLVSTATTVAFGLAPARQASLVDPHGALRERTRSATSDRRQHRVRRGLVVAEVALAVLLLVGAGLLVRTFSSLARVDLGFQPAGTITMGLFLGMRPPDARIAAVDQMLDRVEAVPGVRAAGTIQFLPLKGPTCGTGFWLEEHAGAKDPARSLPTECALVSRGYFAAMGIPVLEGRPFDRRDRTGSARVVAVSRSFAQQYFGGRALGRRIFVQSSNQALAQIVAVVGDVRQTALTSDPSPTVYLLHAQTPGYLTNLVVRTAGDPMGHGAAIRRAIHDVDPRQAVSGVRAIAQDVETVLARPRLQAVLVATAAAIAVLLAAIGLYGLVAYLVTQRTHEIGIRLALGATRRQVFFELFAHGTHLVAIGLGLGVAAAVSLRGMVSTFVFGVATGDPVTYALAALAFCGVALVAILIPARRAARIDPTEALRAD